MTERRSLRVALGTVGLLVTVLCIYLAVRGVALDDAVDALRASDLWWLVPAIPVFALAIWLRAVRWWALFEPAERPPLRAVSYALLVGYFDQDDFVFAGKVGTGFDTKLLLDLRARLDALEIPKAPFTRAVGLPRLRAHWVRPEIVVQVAFIEWTVHGKLRHSRLLGLRSDKPPRQVERKS